MKYFCAILCIHCVTSFVLSSRAFLLRTPTHLAPKLKVEESYTPFHHMDLHDLFYCKIYLLTLALPKRCQH